MRVLVGTKQSVAAADTLPDVISQYNMASTPPDDCERVILFTYDHPAQSDLS